MADAVATRSDVELAAEVKRNDDLIKQLQLQLAQKQTELRRQQQEATMRRDVDTIDRLTQRKLEAADTQQARPNRMLISQENLDRVIQLENAIKLESKRAQEVKHELELIDVSMKEVEGGIQDHTALLEHAKQFGPLSALKNQNEERQKALASLQNDQSTLKAALALRMSTIASLTAELDAARHVEDDLAQAQQMYEAKCHEVADKLETIKSLQRIGQRKEKFLKTILAEDDVKNMKKLEGDKRTLHTDLSKQADLHRVNEKAIAANDARIAQLSGQLTTYAAALAQLFEGKPDRDLHRPLDLAPDATSVPDAPFNALCREVVTLRKELSAREEKLEEADAAIEGMEARIEIINVAQLSQSIKATAEFQELEKQKQLTQDHMARMTETFEAEKQRLAAMNAQLQSKVTKA